MKHRYFRRLLIVSVRQVAQALFLLQQEILWGIKDTLIRSVPVAQLDRAQVS